MTRCIRAFSCPRPTSVETVQKTIQSRYLLRAGPRLNPRVVGALAKAQSLYPARIHAFVCLGNHWHLFATYDDPEQMARFHCHFKTNLSKEAGLIHDWPESMFPERYGHVEVSEEPETELARLKYVLSQGCKEGWVASPLDWPGASCVQSLTTGRPWVGEWIDRTALRRSGKGEASDFSEPLEVKLSPIPSLEHLPPEEYRRVVWDLVREIEEETAAMHRADGTSPMGASAVLAVDPHDRPARVEKKVRPWFHARSPEVRRAMRTALRYIFEAFKEASARLKSGDLDAPFPLHTFPPGRPFVREVEILEPG